MKVLFFIACLVLIVTLAISFIGCPVKQKSSVPEKKHGVPVMIDIPAGVTNLERWPVTFGVPFPKGTLRDAGQVRLVDIQGKEIPSQKEVTGKWTPEGAIKWVRFDALVTPKDGCFMEILPTVGRALACHAEVRRRRAAPPSSSASGTLRAKALHKNATRPELKLTEQDGKIIIDTGVSKYVLGKGSSPIQEIWLKAKPFSLNPLTWFRTAHDRKKAASRKTRGLYVVDQTGRIASASAEDETMVIEARGPVASCVRFEGWYKTDKGENLARHITRVECFAGQPFARVTHTLVLSQSTTNVWFKDIGWEFAVEPGSNPQALFGISRSNWQKTLTQPLASGIPSAYMLQDEHYCFAHGTNHFAVAALDKGEKAKTILEGEECGDWSALSGSEGGLALACRDTALQHPKEFEVSSGNASFLGGDGLTTGRNVPQAHPPMAGKRDEGVPSPTITLHLFSSRAGEELDFRTPTLVKKWDALNWYKAFDMKIVQSVGVAIADPQKKVEEALKEGSDALGWAKTHELMVVPLASKDVASCAAKYAYLNSHPVYALVSSEWSYKSEVFGPLYPKDVQRFPEAEQYLDAVLRVWEQRMADWGDYGFIYYYTGPHIAYYGKYARPYRLNNLLCDYTLRHDFWLSYVRSGERHIRELIEKSSMVFGDTAISHWDGDGRKVKGLFVYSGCMSDFPILWNGYGYMNMINTDDMNKLLYPYYLTGNRRAKDIVEEYISGVKKKFSPAGRGDGYFAAFIRMLAQCYGLTWDPAMRELAETSMDVFLKDAANADGLILPLKDKNMTTAGAFCEAGEILGDPRFADTGMKFARYFWAVYLGLGPIGYQFTQGEIGSILYRETGNPLYAEILALQTRRAAALYNPPSKSVHVGDASLMAFPFDIPYAEDLMARTGADKQPVASWVAYQTIGSPSGLILRKSGSQPLDVQLKAGVDGITVRPVTKNGAGKALNDVVKTSGLDAGCGEIHIPKDAPESAYEILVPPCGFHMAVAAGRIPMVIHAPDYWKPYSDTSYGVPKSVPPVKWYFNVPANSQNPQIFLEYETRLYAPDGKPWSPIPAEQTGLPPVGTNAVKEEQFVTKWVDLPADKPGLWAFEPTKDNMYVRTRNLPPFFTARDPQSYFMPEIAWKHEAPVRPFEKPALGTVYVPGAIQTPDNKALYLEGSKTFRLNGSQFLPFKEGTIEFWFKPMWDTFDLPAWPAKQILTMDVATNKPWSLAYNKTSHSLEAVFQLDHREDMGTGQQIILQAGEWLHLAWVWGETETTTWDSKGKPVKIPFASLFINGILGEGGSYKTARLAGCFPANMPKALALGSREHANDMAYDELRISDAQRYTNDFIPPAKEFTVDEHTRVLFHFNGNGDGTGYGQTAPVMGELK
jgi:hypothetical protein